MQASLPYRESVRPWVVLWMMQALAAFVAVLAVSMSGCSRSSVNSEVLEPAAAPVVDSERLVAFVVAQRFIEGIGSAR